MDIKVNRINNDAGMQHAFAVRNTVFVQEQSVAREEEYDQFEQSAVHFLATVEGAPAGTARWRKTEEGYKLERFAVLKPYRGMGVGAALVRAVLDDIESTVANSSSPVHDKSLIYLHAQLSAIPLYRKFSFEIQGEQFEEAGILHYKMTKTLGHQPS